MQNITSRRQRTLKKKVSFSGIGIHTGEVVSMTFCPEEENKGIYFKRIDLPSAPILPADVDFVCDTARSTTIGKGNIRIHTIEHVMAALKAYRIDNLCIEIDSIEPPVANGGSDKFVEMIEEAGIKEQKASVDIYYINEPIYYADSEISIVALPSDRYRISYTLHYPDSSVLEAQFFTCDINAETFKSEIAPCRTFSKYEEVSYLMDRGLIKGGSLDNAVIIKNDAVFSKGGLFFKNEMCRHKLLDMIGDLSLVGFEFCAHVIAIRAGHGSNFEFAKKLKKHITAELLNV